MPGPAPLPANARARRNKKSTTAALVANPEAEVPTLPPPPSSKDDRQLGRKPEWHSEVLDMWTQLWRSPMASQWGDVEGHGLFQLMVLYQRFMTEENIDLQTKLHAEIRLARRDFGLTPMSRANLHWTILETEEKKDRYVARHKSPQTAEEELSALE